jgi:hypothetical protein
LISAVISSQLIMVNDKSIIDFIGLPPREILAPFEHCVVVRTFPILYHV